MLYRDVCIESIGYHLPETIVTSLELEARLRPLYERIGLREGRLELMSGIRERRFWQPGTLPSQVSAKAGANVFGAVCNTNTSRSLAWNLARSVTFIKAAVEESPIPVHVDMGMGVGGIPMKETPPVDAVSRCNKAMVEIAKVDGV